MTTAHSTRQVIVYPEWQPQYQAALLEADITELPRRVQAAKAAILRRLGALADSPDQLGEREAIENALGALRVLSREASR